MMRVVSGALIRDGRVLMGLRKTAGYRPNLWELPGGKIDPTDPTPHAALAREWHEECAVEIVVRDFISMAMLHMDVSFVIELYRIELAHEAEWNSPHPCDHAKLAWVDPLDAVKWLPCSPAFYLHYPQLQPLVASTRPMSSCDLCGDEGCVEPTCHQCRPTREGFMEILEASYV